MHDEAIYWALLTERHPLIGAVSSPEAVDTALAGLLDLWLSRGNRSLQDLFALHPEPLAATLGMPVDTLGPLLALRARLPWAERSLALLRKAGADILPLWDRRCPRALRAALEGRPPVLWFVGNLAVLSGKAVAVAGARASSPQAVAFSRDLAAALAEEGRVLLTGLTRSVERAALEGALGTSGGTAIAVLGQGMARSLPDLQRFQDPLRAGRLLVISPLHPEAFWQPRLEDVRSACFSALAERVVIADPGDDEGIRHLVRLALDRGKQVLQYVQAGNNVSETHVQEENSTPDPRVRAGNNASEAHVQDVNDTSKAQTELESDTSEALLDGVLPLEWPSAAGVPLAHAVLNTPRARSREPHPHPERERRQHAAAQGRPAATRRLGVAAAAHEDLPRDKMTEAEPAAPPVPFDLTANQQAVLGTLRRRRGTLGKGTLLQLVGVAESDLDSALVMLIASGLVEERHGRTGAGYTAVRDREVSSDGGFQLSLFGQQPD